MGFMYNILLNTMMLIVVVNRNDYDYTSIALDYLSIFINLICGDACLECIAVHNMVSNTS